MPEQNGTAQKPRRRKRQLILHPAPPSLPVLIHLLRSETYATRFGVTALYGRRV